MSRALVLCLFFASCLTPLPEAPADWPQWRGPGRDGVIAGFKPPAVWPPELVRGWSVEVGEGHASPLVVGERVLVFARQAEREVLHCLNRRDGQTLWRTSAPAAAELDGAVGRFGNSPRATPAAADGRVFTLGAAGALAAHDLATGKTLWRLTFEGLLPRPYPEFGAAASPLVLGDVVIAAVGGKDKGALAAFDVQTGRMRWSLPDEGPSYASPVVLDLPGGKQLVTQTQSHVIGVSLTGKRLWRLPFETEYRQNIVTAVAYEGLVVLGGTNKPLAALKPRGAGQPEMAWENAEHACYMSSPVLLGPVLFGMSHRSAGCIFAADARSGKSLWTGPGRAGENVSVQRAGEVLVLLNERGELTFARASDQGWAPLAKYATALNETYAHPVLEGEQMFIKGRNELVQFGWK